MQAAFHTKNQALIKNCCHASRSFHTMSTTLAAILDFSKILFLAKIQQILLELVENIYF